MNRYIRQWKELGSVTSSNEIHAVCVSTIADPIPDSAPDLVKQAVSEKWAIYSLREGLQSLPLALHTALQDRGIEIHLGQACTALQFLSDKIQVCGGGRWTGTQPL